MTRSSIFFLLSLAALPLAAQTSTPPSAVQATDPTATAANAWLSGTVSPYASTNSVLSRAYQKHLPPRALSNMGQPVPNSGSASVPAPSDSLPLYGLTAPAIKPGIKEAPHPDRPIVHQPVRHRPLTPYEYYMRELANKSELATANDSVAAAAKDLAPAPADTTHH